MKKSILIILTVTLTVCGTALYFSGCDLFEEPEEEETGSDRYSYWKGDIPNTYYLLNMYGERARKVTGKPFMVIEYDPVNGHVLRCEFGLSEVAQEAMDNPSDFPVVPEPTLDATAFEFRDKIDIKSPVAFLIGWTDVTTYEEFTTGLWQFSVNGYNERYEFNFNNTALEGDVENLDLKYYFGRESEDKAFKLLKK